MKSIFKKVKPVAEPTAPKKTERNSESDVRKLYLYALALTVLFPAAMMLINGIISTETESLFDQIRSLPSSTAAISTGFTVLKPAPGIMMLNQNSIVAVAFIMAVAITGIVSGLFWLRSRVGRYSEGSGK